MDRAERTFLVYILVEKTVVFYIESHLCGVQTRTNKCRRPESNNITILKIPKERSFSTSLITCTNSVQTNIFLRKGA